MPMPHRTFAQVARRRLAGKEGRERIREVRALLDELPDYRNGPYARPAQVAPRRDRGDARPLECRAPRLDRRAARGRRADRSRRPAERGQVFAAPGALGHPDQDGRLRVHDAPPRCRPHLDRRRARAARRDPRAHRGRVCWPRRWPGAARRASLRGRDRLLRPLRRRSGASSRSSATRSPVAGIREAGDRRRDVCRRGSARMPSERLRTVDRRARGGPRVRSSTTRRSTRSGRPSGQLTGLIRVRLRQAGSGGREAPLALPGRCDRRPRGDGGPQGARRDVLGRQDLGSPRPAYDGQVVGRGHVVAGRRHRRDRAVAGHAPGPRFGRLSPRRSPGRRVPRRRAWRGGAGCAARRPGPGPGRGSWTGRAARTRRA